MELLGKSLEDLFQSNNRSFCLKTVCMIGDQMLSRIESVHKKDLVHRDIKPDNFAIGLEDYAKMIYVLDFGLTKKYRSSKTMEHIKYINNKRLTGTARYASINALKGFEQSRRDDLESIAYILIYFLKGVLPWQGLVNNKKNDRYQGILDKKKKVTSDELSKGLPIELRDFVSYTRNLGFEDEPNYNYLHNLLKQIMMRFKYKFDFIYDWTIILPPKGFHHQNGLGMKHEKANKIDHNENTEDNHTKTNNEDMIEPSINHIGDHLIQKPMNSSRYKFLGTLEETSRAHLLSNQLHSSTIEYKNENKLFSKRLSKRAEVPARLMKSEIIYTSRNQTKNYISQTTDTDCIVF